jgi:hypothetical protein
MTEMKQREDESIVPSEVRAGEHGCPDRRAEEPTAEGSLDALVRQALQLALGDAEPTAAAWARLRETLEARFQGPSTAEEE